MTRFALTHVPALLGNGAIDRLFEEFFQNPEPYVKQTTNGYPLTDIYKEEDGSQVIEMALAGFSKEDILINTEANKITISADGSKLKGQLAESRRRIEGRPRGARGGGRKKCVPFVRKCVKNAYP